MMYFAGEAVPFRYSDMGRKNKGGSGQRKGGSGRGQGGSGQGQGGGSKTSHLDQKRTVSAIYEGEGTPNAHKHDDLNAIQNSQGVQQRQEADPSSSGLQVGTGVKHSGESECKEVTPDSSISTGCEMSDMWHCTECRVTVKTMIDTHPQKYDYVAKLEERCIAHAMGWCQMLEGPSGEQKSDIQSSVVKSSVEDQSVGQLLAEVSCSHIFTLGRGNEWYRSAWQVKVCCVNIWFEKPYHT
jgi:hypothetical protein